MGMYVIELLQYAGIRRDSGLVKNKTFPIPDVRGIPRPLGSWQLGKQQCNFSSNAIFYLTIILHGFHAHQETVDPRECLFALNSILNAESSKHIGSITNKACTWLQRPK